MSAMQAAAAKVPAATVLDLRKPVFAKTAAYGHFGREGFSWEDTSRAADIKSALGI